MSIFSAIGKFFKGAVKVVGKVAAGVLGVSDLFNSHNQKTATPTQAATTPEIVKTSSLQSYILPIGLGALAFYLITKKKI